MKNLAQGNEKKVKEVRGGKREIAKVAYKFGRIIYVMIGSLR